MKLLDLKYEDLTDDDQVKQLFNEMAVDAGFTDIEEFVQKHNLENETVFEINSALMECFPDEETGEDGDDDGEDGDDDGEDDDGE